ncbi:hypothetical protein A28LD_1349 [Idiomarina sp. A28L]|uniref:hypothetical protein n=1 Tax=Idiomarina sp. A28L TaxID=1036674 RepID=UPI000213880D|nr:hypothetical protein [Idiomarina sp. A28L]EGN75124.1 hypothetical protein A28LD_1349 [Idiomarina sp. A28L]
MDILIYIATGLIVVATLLPLSRNPHWIIRGFDFPRMQLACCAALLILLQLIVLNLAELPSWAVIAATALCLAWQLWWVLPYTKLWRTEVRTSKDVDENRQLSILTAVAWSRTTRLSFTPAKSEEQDGLNADQDDKAFASSVANAQNVNKSDVPEPKR